MNTSSFLKIFIAYLMVTGLQSCTQKSLEEKAAEIHNKALCLDSHTDTPLRFTRSDFDVSRRHDVKESRSCVDIPRMQEGGLDAVFLAAFIGQGERTEEGNATAIERVQQIIDSIHSVAAKNHETAGLALNPDDAYTLEKEGKRAFYIGIENGYGLGNQIDLVEEYYNKGARYITLCHTKNNDICDSSTDTTQWNGLSAFGEQVVQEMNRLGVMVDVSHISDSSFYDVLEITEVPVIASHSNARALCNNPRNLTDEMLHALADNNGVIQVCLLSAYVKEPKPYPARDSALHAVRSKYGEWDSLSPEEQNQLRKEYYATADKFPVEKATVSDLVDHIDHIVEIAGIEHVGIGSDFDGGGGLEDCPDVSKMGLITLELVKRGYTEEEIIKIWGGNFMRVFREVMAHKS